MSYESVKLSDPHVQRCTFNNEKCFNYSYILSNLNQISVHIILKTPLPCPSVFLLLLVHTIEEVFHSLYI